MGLTVPGDAVVAPVPVGRPLLRGWSHVVAFVAMLALGGVLIGQAVGTQRGPSLVVVYVACTAAMFGVSAAYHRLPWRPAVRAVMSKLDHCTIFFAIAGAYTLIAVVALNGWHEASVLLTVWLGAAAGVALQWLPVRLPRWVFAAIYVVVGWAALPSINRVYSGLGPLGFGLILGGGAAYTLGALVYARKRPNPWPNVFGFHEVFHALTIVGAGLHFAAMAFVVLPQL